MHKHIHACTHSDTNMHTMVCMCHIFGTQSASGFVAGLGYSYAHMTFKYNLQYRRIVVCIESLLL